MVDVPKPAWRPAALTADAVEGRDYGCEMSATQSPLFWYVKDGQRFEMNAAGKYVEVTTA